MAHTKKDWPLMSLEANITPIAHHCSVCSVIVVFSSFTEFKNRILKLCLTFPFDNSVTLNFGGNKLFTFLPLPKMFHWNIQNNFVAKVFIVFKNEPIPASFKFNFVLFSFQQQSITISISTISIVKSVDGVAGW